jgi:hypothetical protein
LVTSGTRGFLVPGPGVELTGAGLAAATTARLRPNGCLKSIRSRLSFLAVGWTLGRLREVRVFEVRELLRLWLRGQGLRGRDGAPHRADGHGEAWRLLVANYRLVHDWLHRDRFTVRKVHDLLGRGVVVPERTLHRYALEVCDVGRSHRATTVRVADGKPGEELQVDFGKLGRIPDGDRQRDCWALIFTPVVNRYSVCVAELLADGPRRDRGVRGGWSFYGGVFATVIPDNLKAIVQASDALKPRFTQAFVGMPTCWRWTRPVAWSSSRSSWPAPSGDADNRVGLYRHRWTSTR